MGYEEQGSSEASIERGGGGERARRRSSRSRRRGERARIFRVGARLALALCAWLWIAAAGCGGDEPPLEDCAHPGDENGNGTADCDDPACQSSCPAVCGNGYTQRGEDCDDGNTADGDGCDSNCTNTRCGNGVRTMNEGCDDGDTASGDGCDANCMVTGCGNRIRTAGEECDDGNTESGDGCDNNCRVTGCGNGVQTAGEECDDGNLTSDDGCDSNCTLPRCGNGVKTGTEECDDGNATNADGCDVNCTLPRCGNGVRAGSEECDDGNATNGDGCDANCKPTACGNGVKTGSEECDDGNVTNGDGCDANCTTTRCGNLVRTGAEECDDGNATNGDGCDVNCTIPRCGNGVQAGAEECDDGNATSGDGCDANCTTTRCGNGVKAGAEQCDDGNLTSGDGCDANCKPTGCGNGVVTGTEECDDGNTNNTDGCTNACIIQVCGDGELDAPESCDDGNLTSGDGCDANCKPTGCGNGIVTGSEACDDGNTAAFDGCSPQCALEPYEVEPNEDGSISTGAFGISGNDFAIGNADANGQLTDSIAIGAALSPAGDEDVFRFRNTSSEPKLVTFSTWSAALGIGTSCGTTIDTGLHLRNSIGASVASNDNRSASDRCSTVTVGLYPGNTAYAHVMEYDDNAAIPGYVLQVTYASVPCGNGLVEFGEQCDDGNATGGDGCGPTCQIEVVCGDGLKAPGEQCDDGNVAGGDGCSATCQVETTAELEPNNTLAEAAASTVQITGDTTIYGGMSPGLEEDIYRLVVATPTVIRFETFTSIFDCSRDIDLWLTTSSGGVILSDTAGQGVGACGAIVIFLAPGTYFAHVQGGAGTYYLAVDYQIDRGAESEPGSSSGVNDTSSTASGNLLGGREVYVFGDHTLAGDTDFYALTVPGGARIRVELIEGDRPAETCESFGIASELTLFNQALIPVAADNFSGRGDCSLIDGTGASPLHGAARNSTTVPQTFYLMVRAASGASGSRPAFLYRLQVSFR